MVMIVLLIGLFALTWNKIMQFILPTVFTAYLVYGFIRPYISRRMRDEIEDEADDEEEDDIAPR
jgi:CDP-diacylglycerol--serine O-phosphatidyltransferase